MSDQIVPEIDRDENSQVGTKIRWAAHYIQRGWPVFVLGHKKTPVKNCEMCDSQLPGYTPHPMEDCPCLMCHGFYAATLSLDRVGDMLRIRPNGMLAVRTGGMKGAGGGLLVIDAEASADPRDEDNLTGLDVLDDWEGWTGFELAWRETLRQRTASGGLHVVYRVPADVQVGSHNRVLPQVDVKANGGYVAVPDGTNDRHWRPYDPWGQWQVKLPVEAPADLLEWLQRTTGRTYRAGSGGGGSRGALLSEADFQRAYEHGATAGEREPFFAMLSFRLFKRGTLPDAVREECWRHWQRCEQPPGDEFRWDAVEYKIRRDAVTVQRDAPMSDKLLEWVNTFRDKNDDGKNRRSSTTTRPPHRNVTVVRRQR